MGAGLDDLGKLILRFSIGGLLLLHGITKVQNGIGFVEQMVTQNGLPHVLAYGVYVGEIVAPILVIAGAFTRPAALIIAFDLAGAILMARKADILEMGPGGGWAIEVEMLFLLGGLAIACLGVGRLGLMRPTSWN
jgi:putative oxidoreductase